MTKGRPRRRRLRRWLLGVVLLLALAAVGVTWFAGPLLRPRVEAAIADASGFEASLGALDIELLALRAELRDLVLRDAGGERLRLAALDLELTRAEALRGRIAVARLAARGGELDLSRPLEPRSGSGKASASSPVTIDSIELEDFRLRAAEPVGLLSVRARARLDEQGLDLESAELHSEALGRASATGDIRLFGVDLPEPNLELEAEAELDAILRELMPERGIVLDDRVRVSGRLGGTSEAARFVGRVVVPGLRANPGLAVTALELEPTVVIEPAEGAWLLDTGWQAASLRVDRPELAGPLTLESAKGRLSLDSSGDGLGLTAAALLGGGRIDVALSPDPRGAQLRMSASEIDLARLPELVDGPALQGRADFSFEGELAVAAAEPLSGRWSLDIAKPAAPSLDALAPTVEAAGQLSGLDVELDSARVEVAGTTLRASGRLPASSPLDLELRLEAPRISRSLERLALVRPDLLDLASRLRGALGFDGRLSGTWNEPALDGALELTGLSLDALASADLRGRLAIGKERAALTQLRLDGDWGRASGELELPVRRPELARATLAFEELDLSAIAALANLPVALTGRATGGLELAPAGDEPAVAIDLASEALGVQGLQLSELSARARIGGGLLRVETLEARGGEGTLRVQGELPLAPGAPGRLELALTDWKQAGELQDRRYEASVQAEAVVEGTLPLDSLRANGRLWIADASLDGHALPDQSIGLGLADSTLQLSFDEGFARGEAALSLQASGRLEATLQLPELDLEPFLPEGLEALRIGESELALSGSLESPSLTWRLGPSAASLRGLALDLPEGALLRHEAKRSWIEPTRLSVAGRPAFVDAELLHEAELLLRSSLQGELDLKPLLEAFTGAARAEGRLRLDLRAAGPLDELALDGEATVDGVAWRASGLPASLENGRGRLRLNGRRLLLESFEASMGGGRVSVQGSGDWTGASVGAHRLELLGEDVSLSAPEGFTGLADFQLALEGDAEQTTLSGEMRLERGRYVKDLQIERSLASRGRAAPRARAPGPLDRVRLDVALRSSQPLQLRNDLATAELNADLSLRGTAARPLITGIVEGRPGGVLRFQRVSYRLVDALASFGPAHANDPRLQVLAETRVAGHDINLEIGGRLSAPQIELSSVPELPRERLVALLLSGGLVGAPREGPPPTLAEVAPSLAQDYLSGQLDPLERRAREALSLDVVEIDPVLVGGADARGARLTLGKALSERLFLAQSVLLGGAGDTTTELRYRLTERIALRQVHEWDGGNSVEGRWSRSFGPASRAKRLENERAAAREWQLELEGLVEGLDEEGLRKAISLSSMPEATERELRRAAERARSRLVTMGHPLARASCELADEELVRCRLDPGPRLELKVEGLGRHRRRELKAAVTARWQELLRGEDPVESAREVARESLAQRGHREPEVEAEVEELEDRRVVRLRLEPGPVARLKDIDFDGELVLDEGELRKAVLAAAGAKLRAPPVRPKLPAEAADAVERAHRAKGWLDAEVRAGLELDGARARLALTVLPGERVRLGEIRVEGAEAEDAGRWAGRLASGEPVDTSLLDELTGDIVGELDARGHPDAAADWLLSRGEDPTRADVLVSIEPGPQRSIAELHVEGLTRTRESHVLRLVGLKVGDPLSRQALLDARRRLRASGLFLSSIVRESPEREGLVLVRVRERDHLDLTLGAGWDSDDGALGSASLTNRNLDGRGRSTGLHLRLSAEDAQLEGRLHWPRIGGSAWSLLEHLRLRRDEEDGLTTRRVGLRSSLGRPLGRGLRLDLHHLLDRIDGQDVELTGFDPDRDEGRLSQLGLGVVFDSRDDPTRTLDGWLSSAEARVASEALGSEIEQLVLETHLAWWTSIGSRGLVHAGSLRLGAGWPLDGGSRLVLAERFRVGGVGSLRGFRPGRAGPLDPLTGDPLGADAQLVLRNELRIPLTSRLTGLVFLDAGRGFASVEDFGLSDLFASAGPGLAIDTPLGPLRLLYGFAFDRPAGEPSGRLHFTFGTTF